MFIQLSVSRTAVKWSRHSTAEVVAEQRETLGRFGAFGQLAIEDAQRVSGDLAPAVGAKSAFIGAGRRAQHFQVRGSALRAADRIQLQLDGFDADFFQEIDRRENDFGVQLRRIVGENLDAELLELAVSAFLRFVIAEHGAEVVEAQRDDGLEKVIFDGRPHHRSRVLRAQRQAAIGLVGEGVHLFLDDIGLAADAAAEQFAVLEDRSADFPVEEFLVIGMDGIFQEMPRFDFRKKNVPGAFRRFDLVHEYPSDLILSMVFMLARVSSIF